MLLNFATSLKNYLREKNGEFKLVIIKSKLFWLVLGLKIISAFTFGSNYIVKLFIPFTNYFAISGLNNPYAYFYHQNILDVFPYPTGMLWLTSSFRLLFSPLLSGEIFAATPWHLLLLRLPILIADLIIFIVLIRWLKNKQDKVLLYYWCSPILFYINYIHGQLDIIPIMLLFVFLYFLFKEKFAWSFIFLGLSLASKTSILIALPLIFVYLFVKRVSLIKIIYLFAITALVFLVLNFPYLNDFGFQQIVFHNQVQSQIFNLSWKFSGNLIIYFVPLVYFFLLAKSLTFKNFNRDIFIMFLGFSFGILTLLIPPMPGWYYWIIPFFIYFYIKQEDAPSAIFVFLNIFYFLYFFLVPNSDFWQVWQVAIPPAISLPNAYTVLTNHGFNAGLSVDLVFTLLQGILLLNIIWIYKKGVESLMKNKIIYEPYFIGVAGDSGSGKTVLTNFLQQIFGQRHTLAVAGDDLHRWERGDSNWKNFTQLNPGANKLHDELEHIVNLKSGKNIKRSLYDHTTGKFTLPKIFEPKHVVIFQGLHSFFINRMRDLYDLKIYVAPDENLRQQWKILRDTKERGYEEAKVVEQINARQEDAAKYIQNQIKHANIVVTFSADPQDNNKLILKIQFENNINIFPLLSALEQVSGLSAKHYYEDEQQFLEFKGEASSEQVDKIAYQLIPDLWETPGHEPIWESNYNGLIQLFVSYYIFAKMKLDRYAK